MTAKEKDKHKQALKKLGLTNEEIAEDIPKRQTQIKQKLFSY